MEMVLAVRCNGVEKVSVFSFPLNVVQSAADNKPGCDPDAVCTETAAPVPTTAPVPPVTETPVVGLVKLPRVNAFCLLLNVVQSAADNKPGCDPDAVCTETAAPDPTTAPVPPVTETPMVGLVKLPR